MSEIENNTYSDNILNLNIDLPITTKVKSIIESNVKKCFIFFVDAAN